MEKKSVVKLKKFTRTPAAYDVRISEERLMLKLSTIAVAILFAALGFLLEGNVSAIHRSISKISEAQQQMAVMLARVDTNVRNMERRLDKLEPERK